MERAREGPRADEADAEDGGELVLVAVESAMTRTQLWSGLRHSGFAPALVSSAEEARAVLEAHGHGAVLLVDGALLVQEARAWRRLAEAEPPLALVALRVASRAAFAARWVAELGCEALEDPLDLERLLEVVRSLAGGRRTGLGSRASPRPGPRGEERG